MSIEFKQKGPYKVEAVLCGERRADVYYVLVLGRYMARYEAEIEFFDCKSEAEQWLIQQMITQATADASVQT